MDQDIYGDVGASMNQGIDLIDRTEDFILASGQFLVMNIDRHNLKINKGIFLCNFLYFLLYISLPLLS